MRKINCKDCFHYEACKGVYYDAKNDGGGLLYEFEGEMYAEFGCEDFKSKSQVIELPCIAIVEQFIDGNLKFDRKRTAHNGRMAVIYIDKKKHSGFPLIDITDQFYNIDTAEARIKALERSKEND